jgi:hypothetical protein
MQNIRFLGLEPAGGWTPLMSGMQGQLVARPAGLPRNLQQRSPTCLLITTHLSDPFRWKPESSLPAPELKPGRYRMRGVRPDPLDHTDRYKPLHYFSFITFRQHLLSLSNH